MKPALSLRSLVAGATLVALLAAVVSPAQARQAAAPAHAGGVLVYPDPVANLWVKTLDPGMLQDTQAEQVVGMVYSGLLKLNQQNVVVPDLAAGMPSISKDGLTYTLKIRSDAEFSDGTPVTAQDVIYSWTRALSKKENSPVALSYMGLIKGASALNSGKASTLSGVKALDAHTVQVTITQPATYFLAELTYTTYDVVEMNVAAGEDLTGPSAQAKNIGTGPFMFGQPWRYRQEMYLVPNPHYYDAAKMKLSGVNVLFVSDNDTLHREYLSGQVPMTIVPTAFLARESKLPDFHSSPQLAIDYISINSGKTSLCKPISCAPMNDIHWRKAFMYALNRHLINSVILRGAQSDLCGIVPNGIAGFDNKALCALSPYDPTKAKVELALAKKDFGGTLPNEGKITLTYQTSGSDIVREYTEVQSELAAVGINIDIKGVPFNDWVNLVSVNTTPLTENAWIDDYPDPQDFTHNLLSIYGAYDITNFNNPQFEKLIALGDKTPVGPDRTSLYVQAQKIAMQNVAFVTIGQTNLLWRWKSNISGLALGSGFNYPIPAGNDWTNVSVS